MVLLCVELMNEACLPFFWSRDIHSHTHLPGVSMAAVSNAHSDAPEMEPEERVSHAACFLIWLWRRSRARTRRVAFFKNSAVAKIVLHERLSRKIRQSLTLRADLLLLLHSCNGLVSCIVRTRDQQVNRVTLV